MIPVFVALPMLSPGRMLVKYNSTYYRGVSPPPPPPPSNVLGPGLLTLGIMHG